MAWAKLDDAMPHHPKVMLAGPQAFALDVAAICYSNRFGCDGFIADSMLPAVLPSLSSPRRWANKLVQVGRWVRDDDRGGWQIHDIDDYQPTAAEQEEERAAARERMRSLRAKRKRTTSNRSEDVQPNTHLTGGERSGDVRNPVPSRPGVPNGTPPPRAHENATDPPDDDHTGGGGIPTLDAIRTRLTDQDARDLDTDPGRPKLTAAIHQLVEVDGWTLDQAAAAVTRRDLNGATSVAACLRARAEQLHGTAPPSPPRTQRDYQLGYDPTPALRAAGLLDQDDVA